MKALARLLQVGTFIGGSLGASIPLPEEVKYWPNIVVSVAYAAVLATIKPGSTGAKKWIVGSLVLSVLIGILCFWISATYTVNIEGKHYIKGDLQPSVREDIKKRGITEADYFLWSGKKADEVWTPDSVATSTLIVALRIHWLLGCSLLACWARWNICLSRLRS
jgi:hypothetical protein